MAGQLEDAQATEDPAPYEPALCEPAPCEPAPNEPGRPWLGRRRLMPVYAAFCAYATAAAALSAGRDQLWAIWAACGYAAALVMLWLWRGRHGLIGAVGQIRQRRRVSRL